MQKVFSVLGVLVFMVVLSGCGKTIAQIKEMSHSLIDIGFKAAEDLKDNYEAARGVVEDAAAEEEQPTEPTPAPSP